MGREELQFCTSTVQYHLGTVLYGALRMHALWRGVGILREKKQLQMDWKDIHDYEKGVQVI